MVLCILFKKVKINLLLLFLFFYGCSSTTPIGGAYNVIHLGINLNEEIIKNSRRIIFYESDLLLTYNFSSDYERPDYHLLIFNCERKLVGNTALPGYLDSISNYILMGHFDQYGKKVPISGVEDILPPNYKLRFKEVYEGASMSNSDKIISKFKIDTSNYQIGFFVKKSENESEGLYHLNNDTATLNPLNYKMNDTLVFPISKLIFNNSKHCVSYYYFDSKKTRISDFIFFNNKEQMDKLYGVLIDLISKRKCN